MAEVVAIAECLRLNLVVGVGLGWLLKCQVYVTYIAVKVACVYG